MRVAIIGGGFSGLGVAIQLLQHGIKDFVILEKAKQLGGTWRENTYPGCACDVPSHFYSFSFAPKTSWSRVFAEQPEIQEYLLEVANKFGVMPHVRLDTEMQRTDWDPARRMWTIQTNKGPIEAQFIVLGQGPLHDPKLPDVPGIETFQGQTFHSARWNHQLDLTGKRVAVIGTGSSAIQFVPKIQPKLKKLTVFQRTAPWVLPKPDHGIGKREEWAMRNIPGLRAGLRGAIYGVSEMIQVAQRSPKTMQRLQKIAENHIDKQISDPELRRAVTPSFTLGCKRLLLSNTYYKAIQAPNAELVPLGVSRITPTGVIDANGVEREVDVIIFGTGFHVTDSKTPQKVFGADGRSVDDVWDGSPTAYLGTTVSGFPNAFFMIGPNTGNGHGSAFVIIEAQAKYITDAVVTAQRERIAAIDVRPAAQREWNDEVQAALATGVFNAGGCASYYIDRNGRNSSIYPWTTFDLRWRLRKFDRAPFELTPETPKAIPTAPIRLSRAVVAITGGAHGIGLETARRFADAGAQVCIGDLDELAAHQAARSLGHDVRAYGLDVSQRSSFEAFVEAIEREVGPIDVLVNNAGVMPTGKFLEEPDSVDRAAMGVNHFGTALGMKLVLPRMIERGRGHVVNVASLAGKIQVPWMATYVASKHATVGLTGAVRAEIEGSGVTLTVVMPGAVKTRLSAGFPLEGTNAVEPGEVAEAIVDSVRTRKQDVVVPKAFGPLVPLYAVAPRAIARSIVASLHPERIVTRVDKAIRGDYERAIREHRVVDAWS